MENKAKSKILHLLFGGKREKLTILIAVLLICVLIAVIFCAVTADFSSFWVTAGNMCLLFGTPTVIKMIIESLFHAPDEEAYVMACMIWYGGMAVNWVLEEAPGLSKAMGFVVAVLASAVYYLKNAKEK